MSYLHAFESVMSLTGSNADVRTPVKPSELGKVAAGLYGHIVNGNAGSGLDEATSKAVKAASDKLKAAGAKALVVSGSNDADVQVIVAAINQALGAYGTTVRLDQPWLLGRGDEEAMSRLIEDMNGGKVAGLIVHGANPSYAHPRAAAFNAGLSKTAFSVSTAGWADETASRCKVVAPDHHWLESWETSRRTATASISYNRPSLRSSKPVLLARASSIGCLPRAPIGILSCAKPGMQPTCPVACSRIPLGTVPFMTDSWPPLIPVRRSSWTA
jgi:molybdopterin-containing oxidoreductase family iron-sulfur binding subunit